MVDSRKCLAKVQKTQELLPRYQLHLEFCPLRLFMPYKCCTLFGNETGIYIVDYYGK